MNIVSQNESRETKNQQWAVDLEYISGDQVIWTWLELTEEIRLWALGFPLTCGEYGFEILLSPTERNCELDF